jgi:hypothetical protein
MDMFAAIPGARMTCLAAFAYYTAMTPQTPWGIIRQVSRKWERRLAAAVTHRARLQTAPPVKCAKPKVLVDYALDTAARFYGR